jgi:hypothetical protein
MSLWQTSGKSRKVPPGLIVLCIVLCIATWLAGTSTSPCEQPAARESRQLLYLVDSDRNTADSHERVFALDPQSHQIVRSYPTASHPDIALSPDGARLYIASESRVPEGPEGGGRGSLDVFDTATGARIASVADPNRWIAMGPLYSSEMTLTKDGRWLFIRKMMPGPDHTASEFVAIFDTSDNKFLPQTIPLSKCGVGLFLPWPNDRALSLLCAETQEIRTIQLGHQGTPATEAPVVTSIPHDWGRTRLASAIISGKNELTAFMTDGKYKKVNPQAGTIGQEDEIAFSPPLTPEGWHTNTPGAEHVPSLGRRFVSSPILSSQGRLYVPLSRSDLYMHAADAIAVLDAKTLKQETFIELKSSLVHPAWNLFWSAAIGDTGQRLYLLGMESKSSTLRVLSLPEGKEIDAIKGLGATLSIIVPSPQK